MVVGAVAISVPEIATAQTDSGLVTCSGLDCTGCSFVALVNRLVQWLIAFFAIIATVMLAWAGVMMIGSGGDPSAVQKAKNIFANLAIGLIIILAAWMLINVIMQGLTGRGLQFWTTISCGQMTPATQTGNLTFDDTVIESSFDEVPELNRGGLGGGPGTAGSGVYSGEGGEGLSDAEARELMARLGIPAKHNVSYEGLKPHVIAGAATLARKCKCNPLVTSATDGRHANGTYSHSKGYKLDWRTYDNPALVRYVQSLDRPSQHGAGKNAWSNGTQLYYDPDICATYAIEKTHIDVVYRPNCTPAGF